MSPHNLDPYRGNFLSVDLMELCRFNGILGAVWCGGLFHSGAIIGRELYRMTDQSSISNPHAVSTYSQRLRNIMNYTMLDSIALPTNCRSISIFINYKSSPQLFIRMKTHVGSRAINLINRLCMRR